MLISQSIFAPNSLPTSPAACSVSMVANSLHLSSFPLYSNRRRLASESLPCFAVSRKSSRSKSEPREPRDNEPSGETSPPPMTKPRKPRRRGRRSEAEAVEDFIRSSLDQTFASIREQNPEAFENIKQDAIMKEKAGDEDDEDRETEKEFMVDEESANWPLDADVGWGIRASEYFEQHPIRSVVGEDGFEIDWEGEVEDSWVKEINCLEWESFAFHPSPLIVLVFERYNRASDNWKVLKELENAVKVYWKSKDRLPPRAVKIDINIERDLAYALKVRECPQILFLRGNRILYREKETRKADELVHMIAHFYYNAKKPSWLNDTALNVP